jgi:hypothetical protein
MHIPERRFLVRHDLKTRTAQTIIPSAARMTAMAATGTNYFLNCRKPPDIQRGVG